MKKHRLALGYASGLITGFLLCMTLAIAFRPVFDYAPAPTQPEKNTQKTIPVQTQLPLANKPEEIPTNPFLPSWTQSTVYIGGDQVVHKGRIYRAKWWTQGEEPGKADVWEDTLQTPNVTASAAPQFNAPVATPVRRDAFRVVGYYPSWAPNAFDKLRFDVLTHVVYAFAIPTEDGGLRPLENSETAKQLIEKAHANGVQVLIAVGGWSYQDVPLEPTFVSATADTQRLTAFGDAIVALCEQYGFDGVDIDWEHPRVDGASASQYESLMLYLAQRLHEKNKLLTSAVLSGATADGNIYYDAAAHSDSVLSAVDWIHVMAYDGGDGPRHSPYDFMVSCADYWRNKRGLPADKVVMGVPFYGRPSWASYEQILSADSSASDKDHTTYNGMDVYYNGMQTIEQKTEYAMDHLGGIMVWEITQDTADQSKSLFTAIKNALLNT